MLHRFKQYASQYPGQFWLMFIGMFISTVGSSMVWPFLMIYMTKRLSLPLTTAASLMSLNAAVALASAFLAGPIIDRVGRKWIMVISMLGIGMVYLFYIQANSYAFAAALMALTGLFNPLFRVGADAMVADLIPPEKRADAYAMTRMANNLGIAIGPAIGGLAAATSYSYAFIGGAVGMTTYAVLMAIFGRETLSKPPASDVLTSTAPTKDFANPKPGVPSVSDAPASTPAGRRPLAPKVSRMPWAAYSHIFADRSFMYFIVAFTFTQVCAALIWVLLGVHANKYFSVPESQYGIIPMTNALMVVTLQAIITRQTRKHAPLPVLAVGSLFYAVAVTSVALGRGFGGFWISMVIMTLGELMLMPTSTTYTANLAPADMRGRYMSVYSLTWGIAQGIGPVAGGFLSDSLGPPAPWLGGGLVGLLAVMSFVVLASRAKSKAPSQEAESGA